ncbi:MAG TPA: hypothetical protein VI383_06315 [Gemmatimonadales bacterium]|nr:hypothetical protein [Gemmatimonadales bacterium]
MHRHSSLTGAWWAALGGLALHVALVPLELALPGIEKHNLDPLLRTLPPLVAGLLVPVLGGRPGIPTLAGGSLAGLVSGLFGGIIVVLLDAPSRSPTGLVVSLSGTGFLLGTVGGLIGWWARARRPRT